MTLILFGIVSSFAQETPRKTDPALIQSLVFPGVGQIREKQYAKGILLAAAECFCIVQAFVANQKADRYYWNYRFSTNTEETLTNRQLTERFDRKRNQYILIGAGIWVLNLVDIHTHIKRKQKTPVQISIRPNTDDRQTLYQISLVVLF